MWFGVAAQDNRVVATCFSPEKVDVKTIAKRLPKKTSFQVVKKPDQFLADVFDALNEVLDGNYKEGYGFAVDVSHLSGYTQKVLNCTRLVPVGYVTSYGAIADAVGGSARAVGQVEASNPVPLLIQCHRVVRSDLSIGGYGYGKETKLRILQKEDRGYEESTSVKVGDKSLMLFPVKLLKQNI